MCGRGLGEEEANSLKVELGTSFGEESKLKSFSGTDCCVMLLWVLAGGTAGGTFLEGGYCCG